MSLTLGKITFDVDFREAFVSSLTLMPYSLEKQGSNLHQYDSGIYVSAMIINEYTVESQLSGQ